MAFSLQEDASSRHRYFSANETYEKIAASGSPSVVFEVGRRFHLGLGVEKDLAAARRHYQHAAEAGCIPAMYNLASILFNGYAVERDVPAAKCWYERAAKLGDAQSMMALGLLLRVGLEGVPKDVVSAKSWLEQSAELGRPDAMKALADLLLSDDGEGEKDVPAAKHWYGKAAELGDVRARSALEALENGTFSSVEGPHNQAPTFLEHMEEGSKQGDATATNALGVLYLTGDGGVEKDVLKARTLFVLASLRGNCNAMSNLAQLLETGYGGVERDILEAKRYYEAAVRWGNVGSMILLGKMILRGREGVEVDEEEASKLFQRAAKRGCPSGLEYLGHWYCGRIDGVSRNGLSAARAYANAMAGGSANAKDYLVTLLISGKEAIEKNPNVPLNFFKRVRDCAFEEASFAVAYLLWAGDELAWKELLERAIEMDNAKAFFSLGTLLMDGEVGVKSDPPAASSLFERAAALGHPGAAIQLSEMLRTGAVGVRRNLGRAEELLEMVVENTRSPWAETRLAQLLLLQEPVSLERQARAFQLLQSAAESDLAMAHHELAILEERRLGDADRAAGDVTARSHFKAAVDGSLTGLPYPGHWSQLIAAGSDYRADVVGMLSSAVTKPNTCLLLTLGGGGRGKTSTMNSMRGMPFVIEHVPTEMAAVSKFILDPGTRGLDEDLIEELDFNENSLYANAAREAYSKYGPVELQRPPLPVVNPYEAGEPGDDTSEAGEPGDETREASQTGVFMAHLDVVERVRRSFLSNPIPRGSRGAVVRCWDMAGQSVYEMAHSLVIRHGDIILFVVNLQRVSDVNTRDSEVGLLCYWMQLAHVVVADPSRVKAIILGTHKESSNADVLELLHECLQEQLGSAVYDSWIKQQTDDPGDGSLPNLLAIENSKAEKQPFESGLEGLEKAVRDAANEVVTARSEVPLCWFALVDKLERCEKKYISKAELQDFCIGFPGFHKQRSIRNQQVYGAVRCFASMGRVVLFEEPEEDSYYVFLDVDRIIALVGKVTAPEKRLRNHMSKDELIQLREGRISCAVLFKLWDNCSSEEKEVTLKMLCQFDLLMMLESRGKLRRDNSRVIGVPALLPCGWENFYWSRARGEFDFAITTQFVDAVPLGLIGMLMAHLHRTIGGTEKEKGVLRRFLSLLWRTLFGRRLKRSSRVKLVRANAALLTTEDGSRVFVGFKAAERQLCWKFRGKKPVELAKKCISQVEKLLTQRMDVRRKHVIVQDCDEPCGAKGGLEIELARDWWDSSRRVLANGVGQCHECHMPCNAEELIQAQLRRSKALVPSPHSELVMPQRDYEVFLSHAGPDKLAIARPIFQALERHGVHCFLDMERLQINADSAPLLMNRAMAEARIGVFILSPQFAARKWTMKELRHFLHRNSSGGSTEGAERPTLLPVFARLSLEECASVYEDEGKHRAVLEEEGFFESARQEECSTELAAAAMRTVTRFSGVEATRIGGGHGLSTAELVDETVRRVLQVVNWQRVRGNR